MHTLIAGITGTGKTTLAVKIADGYIKKGTPVIVLDPFKDKRWNTEYIYDNQGEFLQVIFSNKSCAVFIDESGKMVGRYGGVMNDVATMGRHNGHKIFFITQRPKQIDVNSRTQCTKLLLFRLSDYDSKTLACEFACDDLRKAAGLQAGEFLFYSGIGKITKNRVF